MQLNIIPITFGTPEFDDALRLRYEVLRLPLGMEFEVEQIAQEYDDIHLAAYSAEGHLVGYLSLQAKDDSLKMRQVAVAPALQGKGIGRAMVEVAEQITKSLGYKKVLLHARDTAIPFYEKLQYDTIGEPFMEVGIKHAKMEKVVAE